MNTEQKMTESQVREIVRQMRGDSCLGLSALSNHELSSIRRYFGMSTASDHDSLLNGVRDKVMLNRPTFAITDFVRRQTKESRFSHYEGTFDELQSQFAHRGNADISEDRSIKTIWITSSWARHYFRSSVIPVVEGMELEGIGDARQGHEEPVKTCVANGSKVPAEYVELILYSRESLAKEGIEIEEQWGLVSINCSPTNKPTPMAPSTMARNQLEKAGGTKREYTSEEWAEAVWFWSTHVQVSG